MARVRRGALDAAPRYWDGRAWVADAARAVNIAPATGPDGEAWVVNPMQFTYAHGRWLAVTKEGDWWGSTIYLDRASRPTGPWTTTARLRPEPLGAADDHNTYFASIVAVDWRTVVVGLSNNRWDGRPSRRLSADVRGRADGGLGPAALPGSAPGQRRGDGGERLVGGDERLVDVGVGVGGRQEPVVPRVEVGAAPGGDVASRCRPARSRRRRRTSSAASAPARSG